MFVHSSGVIIPKFGKERKRSPGEIEAANYKAGIDAAVAKQQSAGHGAPRDGMFSTPTAPLQGAIGPKEALQHKANADAGLDTTPEFQRGAESRRPGESLVAYTIRTIVDRNR